MRKIRKFENTKLMVVDDLPPEDVAMLQAIYSRSAESAESHFERAEKSAGRFMSDYYVGYGHKSIADCGSTTMFIEGVSLLAAKAVQDWPLYNGQETSTRYIDMTKQKVVDPVGTDASRAILERWMTFYTGSQDRVAETVRTRYPKTIDEDPKVYERAVKARTFDILRGFLPAGITTQLSWHTNLRQAGDHLLLLRHHPSAEVRGLATELRVLLGECYPSSGGGMSLPSVSGIGVGNDGEATARAVWESQAAEKFTYPAHKAKNSLIHPHVSSTISDLDLKPYYEIMDERPRGCVLPHFLSDLGNVHFEFLLDFGAHRDIQRHRNGVCRMPILTTTFGFEPWYLHQLDRELFEESRKLIHEQSGAIDLISENAVEKQYYIPIGYRVPCLLTYGLPAAIYVMELRSGKMIHPTLRRAVHRMIEDFQQIFPQINMHVDMSPDSWDVRRGKQTIEAKT